jgi:hypothetical protein
MHIVVERQTGQVGAGEGDGESAKKPVQVQVPGWRRHLAGQSSRHNQTPQDRGGNQCPGDQSTGTGHVPPKLMIHDDRHGGRLVMVDGLTMFDVQLI